MVALVSPAIRSPRRLLLVTFWYQLPAGIIRDQFGAKDMVPTTLLDVALTETEGVTIGGAEFNLVLSIGSMLSSIP